MKGYFSGALAFGVLSAAAVLACAALSLRLRHRAEESDARMSDRALYELGKRDAESAKADAKGPLGKMLRGAGIEASPVSCALCLGTVGAFVAFSPCGQAACLARLQVWGWLPLRRRCTCCVRG